MENSRTLVEMEDDAAAVGNRLAVPKKQIRSDINRQMIQKHEQKLMFIMALLKMATKQKKPVFTEGQTDKQTGRCLHHETATHQS